MKYISTAEIAERWGISDRRVRVLCRNGRIPGVVQRDGVYLIPYDAEKPSDRRFRNRDSDLPAEYSIESNGTMYFNEPQAGSGFQKYIAYLKWEDDIIAGINDSFEVFFFEPEYNNVVREYTHGRTYWSRGQFEAFLESRIVSRDRRDIEKILFRCGLSVYDSIRIGLITHAVNAGDMLWISDDRDRKMQDAVSQVFNSVFLQKIDAEGDSIDTPEGYNIKRYGARNGHYGIYKRRISPVSADAEAELAVYGIARLMGVPCCPVYRVDEDNVFSQFEYDFAQEYIVHMRRLFDEAGSRGTIRGENEYLNLLSARPQYQADFVRMIALDFVTRQDDRHLSNIAVKISAAGESFYPLYDNGRSLFYDDTEETAARACGNMELFSTGFGPSGTYYDYVREISKTGIQFGRLMDLDISEEQIERVLHDAGFKGYRFEAALKWITDALGVLRGLDGR